MQDESDYMELGDSGLVPQKGGWLMNRRTGDRISPEGLIYNRQGELIYDPNNIAEDENNE